MSKGDIYEKIKKIYDGNEKSKNDDKSKSNTKTKLNKINLNEEVYIN